MDKLYCNNALWIKLPCSQTCIFCFHECSRNPCSQMAKFGLNVLIQYSLLWKNEGAGTCTDSVAAQGTTRQRELSMLAEEVQHCILYNSHWVQTCFIMYCTTVTFPFITLPLVKVLIMRFVQLARESFFALVKEALRYNLPFCTTRTGCTLASLCTAALQPSVHHSAFRTHHVVCATCQRELFMLEEEAQHWILYGSHWVHTCFVMYWATVTFPFITLSSGRGLIMRCVQLARESSSRW